MCWSALKFKRQVSVMHDSKLYHLNVHGSMCKLILKIHILLIKTLESEQGEILISLDLDDWVCTCYIVFPANF